MIVRDIKIIGGGSSGWMTAAALSKLCPHVTVTLIESKKISTIGVGESTLGHITKFLGILNLKDEDWMASCNATYKNSIRFTNFRENDGSSFQYPFSLGLDFTDKPGGLSTWAELSTIFPEEFGPKTFAEFFATDNTMLADHCKQTKNEKGLLRHFDFRWDTAYHCDAQLFGKYLKENVAIPNGVRLIEGDILSHEKDNQGYISKIKLEDGSEIAADLWIDCTGFRSILLEQWMGQEFLSFDDYLMNDSAWACRLPYEDREKEMHNYTDCHALDNGWVWHIPLWNRIGTGYVYSSKFTSKESAQEEFRRHLATTGSKERAEKAEMFHIDIKHGRRRRAWVKNVVGVGLSYGFVEPLESTGLLTTHENIIKLIEMLNRRNGVITRSEKEGFNYAVDREVLKFRDFVSQHYALSMRDDSEYWRYVTEHHEYCPELIGTYSLQNTQYLDLLGNITMNQVLPSGFLATLFIAGGMGLKNISTKELILHNGSKFNINKLEELDYTKKKYYQYKDLVLNYIKTLPSHYEFLKKEIYGGKDDYSL